MTIPLFYEPSEDCMWEVHTFAGWPGWTGNQGCDPNSRCCPAGCPRMALRIHPYGSIEDTSR